MPQEIRLLNVPENQERVEDMFLLLIYPAWSSGKRRVPGEMKAEEEGRKVKNKGAANLGPKRWQKDRIRRRAAAVVVLLLWLLPCGRCHLPRYAFQ